MTQLADDDVLSYRRAAADIFTALNDPRAALMTELADTEDAVELASLRDSFRDDADALDTLHDLLVDAPERSQMSAKTKHDNTCWHKHVGCFADRIRAAFWEPENSETPS